MGGGEGFLSDGADKGEGGVKDNGGLGGAVDVLVGIADGDGAHRSGEASTHPTNGQGDEEQKGKGIDEVVLNA